MADNCFPWYECTQRLLWYLYYTSITFPRLYSFKSIPLHSQSAIHFQNIDTNKILFCNTSRAPYDVEPSRFFNYTYSIIIYNILHMFIVYITYTFTSYITHMNMWSVCLQIGVPKNTCFLRTHFMAQEKKPRNLKPFRSQKWFQENLFPMTKTLINKY